jgi:hypothetical protein
VELEKIAEALASREPDQRTLVLKKSRESVPAPPPILPSPAAGLGMKSLALIALFILCLALGLLLLFSRIWLR